jgi:lipoprotein signal peptidase
MMEPVHTFLKPTLPKLIFGLEWVGWVALRLAGGQVLGPHQWLVAFVVLLLLYALGCTLVAWSRRAERVASGRGLALLIFALVALDQGGKAAATQLVQQNSGVPLVEGWLHLVNVPNLAASWCMPACMKPVLFVCVLPVPVLTIIAYRYYVSEKRRSLWADLSLIGLTAGSLSWLVDTLLRGYVLDFISVPDLIAVDLSDLYLLLAWSVLVELLENPDLSRRWIGWRAEYEEACSLVRDVAAFTCRDVRSWWPFGRSGKRS